MTDLLLTEKLLTMDAGIFAQIRAPSITDAAGYNDHIARAEAGAIGYAVTPAKAWKGTQLWLIVQENGDLWRWGLFDAELYDAAREEHEWLRQVPQIFLVGHEPKGDQA